MEEEPSQSVDRERHALYLQMVLESLPSHYEEQEINRVTLAYFAVSGLAILGALDRVDRDHISSWIISLQLHPKEITYLNNGQFYGFHGSRSSQFSADDAKLPIHNGSHLASTFCSLNILKTIGYDLSGIDTASILNSMRNLQQPDGSFMPIHNGAETDVRFVYCAAAICHMLNNWTGMNKELAKVFILKCQSYDGGFSLLPGGESHGGATYCAVAALKLMGFIESTSSSKFSVSINLPLLLEWSLQRQGVDGGFQGRINKPTDTCYAFWVGGILTMLGGYQFLNKGALRKFLLSCESQFGGFTKFPSDVFPDLYHSYYGLSALSLLEEVGFKPLCVELGLSCTEMFDNHPQPEFLQEENFLAKKPYGFTYDI